MQLHDSFVMVPLENISLHLHFTLFYIIFLPSSSCTIPHLYSSIHSCTISYFLVPLQCFHHFHYSILPSILSPRPLFIFLYFSAPIFSHPTRSLYHTLYSLFLLLIPLSLPLFIFLFISTSLPTSLPNFHFLHFLHSSISFSFYNFLSLTLSPSHSPLQ